MDTLRTSTKARVSMLELRIIFNHIYNYYDCIRSDLEYEQIVPGKCMYIHIRNILILVHNKI